MSSSTIRYLKIEFDQSLQAYELPYFRAAVIEKTKRKADTFHNHDGQEGYRYRYPLIQYKIKDRRPCMVCLEQGTDDVHLLLGARDFSFLIGDRPCTMSIRDLQLSYVELSLKRSIQYTTRHYLALNQENYTTYKQLTRLVDMLAIHLGIFAEEVAGISKREIRCSILEIIGEKFIKYKNIYHQAVSLRFETNLTLPPYIGIGKGVSLGFGSVIKSK